MSQTNEAQFIGSIPTVNTEMETRQITLPRETWEELDKLAENCPDSNIRSNPNRYPSWALNVYLWLCKQDERYRLGILPAPQRPARKPKQE